MSFATVEEFLGRLDPQVARDLSAVEGSDEIDEGRVAKALEDATAELEGYLPRVPVARRPSDATLRVHAIKVATYLLSLGRPGKEFEQIRNAYTDTIAFYTGLIEESRAASPLGGTADAPPPVFNRRSLKGFV